MPCSTSPTDLPVVEPASRQREATLARCETLSRRRAAELTDLFKTLASETRLRLLHALVCRGELCVSDLCQAVGMKPQAVSNQLQRLAEQRIVASRREGLQIFYRVVDPCVPDLLDRGICLLADSKEEAR